jgi:hypothetical protein
LLIDSLLARARSATVRDELAAARVAELARWARRAPARRAWWALGAATVVGVAAIVVLVTRPAPELRGEPVQVGARVAIVAEPGTRYRLAVTTAELTDIVVERGAVTARLWPGAVPHRLALHGGDLTAIATGTNYTLAVDEAGHGRVTVHEGSVALADGTRVAAVSGGRGATAAVQLAARAPPPPPPVPSRAPAPAPEPEPEPAVASPSASPPAPPPRVAPPAPTLADRWSTARAHRARGDLAAAVAACIALADARDPTWSPIALLEAIQIELGPRTAPANALALADRFLAEWPDAAPAVEVRALRCRAAKQLGRGC